MLAKRIIPCLDVKDGRVVKGVNFVDLIDAGDPVAQAQVYDREGAACPSRGCKGTIERVVQSGRSTFYCHACQR